MRRALAWPIAFALAACGVRAPSPIDTTALVRTHGADEARSILVARVIEDPKDVQARLALAALSETSRPSEAIEQLDAVERLGGVIGVRWHDEDRDRFARLLLARATARTKRLSPTAIADYERARRLGATVDDTQLESARILAATWSVRHADPTIRARAHAILDAKRPIATVAQRGEIGLMLFSLGAKRAGWEDLDAWHTATPRTVRQPEIHAAYLRALAWWSPIWSGEAAPPPADDLVGAEACRFGACLAREASGDPIAEAALVGALGATPIRDPIDAGAYVAIAIRNHAPIAGRLDLAALGEDPRMPPAARAMLSRIGGPRVNAPIDRDLERASRDERLIAAFVRALDGEPAERVQAALGANHPDAVVLDAPHVEASADLATGPIVAYALDAAALDNAGGHGLDAIVAAYRRSSSAGERVARDYVQRAVDAASASAAIGAVFTALGDPARARLAWQAAVDGDPDPRYLARLAEAIARAGDGDAALVAATRAAAASGDPAVTWLGVARVLEGVGQHVFALEASRAALDLAGDNTIVDTLELASVASRALGRDAQADAFDRKRARLVSITPADPDRHDPTDPAAALAAYRRQPGGATIARMYVAARWSRDLPLLLALHDALSVDDPRRATVAQLLAAIAPSHPYDIATIAKTLR